MVCETRKGPGGQAPRPLDGFSKPCPVGGYLRRTIFLVALKFSASKL